ncbi:MAG: hypothetical protein NW214_08580 [Pseudanabaenaceae cyanobacterium bins.39]|nr:hypothetical protein [Pseudanabaenaceae cyanobacterium bins.39]
MAKSNITRYFSSLHLQHDGDDEFFFFLAGTPREEIIDTLEEYLNFRGLSRVYRYELIGDVLNSNSFREVFDPKTEKFFDVCISPITVSP